MPVGQPQFTSSALPAPCPGGGGGRSFTWKPLHTSARGIEPHKRKLRWTRPSVLFGARRGASRLHTRVSTRQNQGLLRHSCSALTALPVPASLSRKLSGNSGTGREKDKVAWRSTSAAPRVRFRSSREREPTCIHGASEDGVSRRFVRQRERRMWFVCYEAPFADENKMRKHRTDRKES